jgi:hypothetical protein
VVARCTSRYQNLNEVEIEETEATVRARMNVIVADQDHQTMVAIKDSHVVWIVIPLETRVPLAMKAGAEWTIIVLDALPPHVEVAEAEVAEEVQIDIGVVGRGRRMDGRGIAAHHLQSLTTCPCRGGSHMKCLMSRSLLLTIWTGKPSI